MRASPPLVVLILGGAAERWDCPPEESPLFTAATPNLDRLAESGRVFGVELADEPFSAAPLLALLGYDLETVERSRAAYLGRLIGEELAPEECFVSADFVALFRDTIADVAPGPWRPAEILILLRAAGAAMQRAGYRLVPASGGSHHLAVAPCASIDETTPLLGETLGAALDEIQPAVQQHAFAHRLGRDELDGHEINEVRRDLGRNGADMIWLSGPGRVPELAPLYDFPVAAFGLDPVWRGICGCAGIPIKAKGAKTLAGLVRAVGHAIAQGDGLCVIHNRRGTMAAQQRDLATRAAGIATLDEELIGPLAKLVQRRGGRLLVVPDAGFSTTEGRALRGPVPALVWGVGVSALSSHPFTEAGAAAAGDPLAPGHGLLPYVLRL